MRLPRPLLALALPGLFSASIAAAPTPAPAALFDYDRAAPLEVREVSRITQEDAVVRDVTFVGVKEPVRAYIVAPVSARPPYAGLLYVHWLGKPETTNRTEFLVEAVALAHAGAVSVLVDAMWAAPKWYEERVPEDDYAHALRQVIELRRAMDLLLAQPDVDPKRIAYVGHDFGAMYGTVMGAVDGRASTYVLMAGTPHFADWFLFARQPKDPAAYRAQLAPLDPANFAARLAPAPVFFQFAAHDEYVSASSAAEFYNAAAPRKQMATYDAHHDLQVPAATADRITWLMRTLNLQ